MLELEPIFLAAPGASSAEAPIATTLIRVTCDNVVAYDDLVAYGEAATTDPEAVAAALEFFADILQPADPLDRDLVWQRMAWAMHDYQPQPLADYAAVMSALDVTLWDLAGRQLGLPVAQLMGGRRSARVDCYGVGPRVGQSGDLVRAALELRRQVGSVQLLLGGDLATDIEAVREVRLALGTDTPLRLDAAGAYPDAEAVMALSQALEPQELFWFQDPLPPGDWETWRSLRQQLPLGLAGGRTMASVRGAARALAAEALDVITPDLRLCGGLTGARRLADLAWLHGVSLSLCGPGTPLSQLAAAHLAATALHSGPMEVAGMGGAEGELLEPPLRFDQGFLMLPEGPGLGARVNEEFVSRHRVGT